MNSLEVAAVVAYLNSSGWTGTGRSWNGGAIWSNGTEDVLVPPRDGMGDSELRLREVVLAVADAEQRTPWEVVWDITNPHFDLARYQLAEREGPDGYVGLTSAVEAIAGIEEMVGIAAGQDVATGLHLGSLSQRHFSLTLLVPTPQHRMVFSRLHQATAEVLAALTTTTSDQVSAAFCTALSRLTGEDQPLVIDFRFAGTPAVPRSDLRLEFPPGAGPELGRLADRSRRPQSAAESAATPVGVAVMTGRIEALHDNERGSDRWRIQVRGEFRLGDARPARRIQWVRLAGQTQYDLALDAHRDQAVVTIHGRWTDATRARLHADPDGLHLT